MNQTYYIVDVFTDRVFNGAQIGVFPEADALNAKQMQLLARELNLSDTVFILKSENSECDFKLKVYSPISERNFVGHATIAAAYVLGKYSYVELKQTHTEVTLEQDDNLIDVIITNKPDDELFIQFNRKMHPVIDRYVPDNKDLAAALSLDEGDIASARYNTLLVACDLPYLIVPLRSFDAVRRAVFNMKQWSTSVAPVSPANELLLFSTKSDLNGSNFHGRLVGPRIGIDEDPPIGSSMPAFAGYLSAHEHIREGTHSFVIDRGTLEQRKSVLSVELVNREGRENEIRVGGPAVLVAEGKISIP
ncbi:MAG: PhzF family phenazine biosynthesis protein [Gammaproteobacteria bacterium]|nr:PhzF family phenazine biosynthesis protein [Gammaproteobacteria bacterium]